jgi:hypothetical protein
MQKIRDVDEADQVAKFALYFLEQLAEDEEFLWKLICESRYIKKRRYKNAKWTVTFCYLWCRGPESNRHGVAPAGF